MFMLIKKKGRGTQFTFFNAVIHIQYIRIKVISAIQMNFSKYWVLTLLSSYYCHSVLWNWEKKVSSCCTYFDNSFFFPVQLLFFYKNYGLTTPTSFRKTTATVINVASRYSKVTMYYTMRLLTESHSSKQQN